MAKWDGRFETSKEYNASIEQRIKDNMEFEIGKADDDGGLIKSYYGENETYGKWEMYGPSDSKDGHYHADEKDGLLHP